MRTITLAEVLDHNPIAAIALGARIVDSHHGCPMLLEYDALMEGILSDYLLTTWGFSVTALLTLIFGAKSYDVFAKLWLAHTGKYRVEGKITYSEFMQQPVWTSSVLGNGLDEGLITYSYHVDGQLFTGKIPLTNLTQQIVDECYYTGATVDVFYSPRLPTYSFTGEVPSKLDLARRALVNWFLLPVSILSVISIFIWALVDLAGQS